MLFNKNVTSLVIFLTFIVTHASAASGTIKPPPLPNTGHRYKGCYNESTCKAKGGALCFPPAGTNPCLYSKDTPSPCGKLVKCASPASGNTDPFTNPDCGGLIARQGTSCPSASAPDPSWYGCFSTIFED